MATEHATLRTRAASERGAILIQVGVAILVLIAFAMFVVDYGVLWVSRNQAQNAADAGALAGAMALAFDDFDDRTDTGPAQAGGPELRAGQLVWGEAPDVQMATDVRFYATRRRRSRRRAPATTACASTSTATRRAATRCRCSSAGWSA